MRNEVKVNNLRCNKIIITAIILFGLMFSYIGLQQFDNYCEQNPYADSIH